MRLITWNIQWCRGIPPRVAAVKVDLETQASDHQPVIATFRP